MSNNDDGSKLDDLNNMVKAANYGNKIKENVTSLVGKVDGGKMGGYFRF